MGTSHSLLIVDDDSAIRDAFGELLESEGYQVSLAANGEAALDHLRDGKRPCPMIVDLLMPVLDGWEFAARVATMPHLAAIPFLVVSGESDGGARPSPSGARVRLTKPVAVNVLLSAVTEHCRHAVSLPRQRQSTPVHASPG